MIDNANEPGNILLCIMTVYFIFIFIFGDREYRSHSLIISISSIVYWFLPIAEHSEITEIYISNYSVIVNISMSVDIITAIALLFFMFFDKLAAVQSLILAFAVLCHVMIIYDLTISSGYISHFFYNYYDEMIIATGIMQMAVSYDGIIRALNNIQYYLCGRIYNSDNIS